MIKGVVYNIKETNKYCKIIIDQIEYIYFKNKSNTFDETVTCRTRVMKLIFDGSYVELTANHKNIIEDLYIDVTKSNQEKWYNDFQNYLVQLFKSPFIENFIKQSRNENEKDMFVSMMYNTRSLKDPVKKTLRKDIESFILFYKNHYYQLGIANVLRNDIKDSRHNIKQITFNKHIKKISKKIDYESFKQNPYIVLDGATAQLF
jgi:hypothetical protein